MGFKGSRLKGVEFRDFGPKIKGVQVEGLGLITITCGLRVVVLLVQLSEPEKC